MLALVTGVAGFIGSNLADRLIADGWDVRGVDRFTAYYEEAQKRANIVQLMADPRFELVQADLLTAELGSLLEGVDVVFHQAAQPGVRLSWADGFRLYNDLNVNVTQRLLESSRTRPIRRFVYASSSSVYGQAPSWPTLETSETRPHSPYGVTKLAGELLCGAYAANFAVPTTSLRYFTVYGPRQRPDMATHRLIECALDQRPFPLFGDGSQERAFTFVQDVVDATFRAGVTPDVAPGSVFNVSGRFSCTLSQLIDLVGKTVGAPVPLDRRPAEAGDATKTGGSTERIEAALGWSATTSLEDGVAAQVAWHRSLRS